SASTDDEYNANWAGVVAQTDEGSITGVSASFTLPTVKKPTDGDQVNATDHTASTWIGIDGYSCGTGLWQAGVDGTIDESGTVSWYAWYEWYPGDTVEIDIGDLATGDVITVNVTASSTTEGVVTMSNAASGKSYSKTVTSTYELCLADAEWIEEDLVVDDAVNEGLANFGSVTFEDAIATTKTGTLSPGDDPIYMDVEDSDGNILTSSSASGNTVTVKYV
ncbi:concanavalin A-like lectin/glucanase, partial [Cryphonectria parasitica EP155]